MSFDLKRPCPACPFTIQPGAIKLGTERVEELAYGAESDDSFMFYCHEALDYNTADEDGEPSTVGAPYCAGALIFQERTHGPSQMMRIGQRLGMYDPTKLAGHDLVYEDSDSMLNGAVL